MTNARGGVECDVTVARLAEDRFRIVTGTAFGAHDAAWLRTHGLEVTDVTSQYACFGLWGPRRQGDAARSTSPTCTGAMRLWGLSPQSHAG